MNLHERVLSVLACKVRHLFCLFVFRSDKCCEPEWKLQFRVELAHWILFFLLERISLNLYKNFLSVGMSGKGELRHGVNLDRRSKAGELASELHRSANILSAALNAMSDFVLIVACADLRAVHVMRCLP